MTNFPNLCINNTMNKKAHLLSPEAVNLFRRQVGRPDNTIGRLAYDHPNAALYGVLGLGAAGLILPPIALGALGAMGVNKLISARKQQQTIDQTVASQQAEAQQQAMAEAGIQNTMSSVGTQGRPTLHDLTASTKNLAADALESVKGYGSSALDSVRSLGSSVKNFTTSPTGMAIGGGGLALGGTLALLNYINNNQKKASYKEDKLKCYIANSTAKFAGKYSR